MNALDVLNLVMRWTHILAAMTAAGGTFFVRFALLPAQEVLSAEQRQALHAALRARWSKVVMISITALLVSGLYNIGMIEAKTTAPQVYRWYHAVFGVKFLLAMVLFMIASLLVGKTAAAEKIRKNSALWLNVNLALIVAIVLLSGVLRTAVKDPKPAKPAAAADSDDKSAADARLVR
jgi:uncharacterized membrane protein